MIRQHRQQRVRGGGGDDFDASFVLKFPKCADEIAVICAPRIPNRSEPAMIHPGEFVEGAVPVCAADFLFGQLNETVQVPFVTPAQQRVEQHRAECRRE